MQSVKEFARQFILWTPVAMHLNEAYVRIDRVSGVSMQPTLNPPRSSSSDEGEQQQPGSDIVLCELLSSSYFWYQPGDIVIIR